MSDPFVYRMHVRFNDTDAQGHVYFANYFVFCDEAWTAYMRHIGLPYQELNASGVDIFYVNAECSYGGSAVYEEELLIEPHIEKIGGSSITTRFVVRNERHEALADATLTCVCVDPDTRTPIRVPDRLRQLAGRYEGDPSGFVTPPETDRPFGAAADGVEQASALPRGSGSRERGDEGGEPREGQPGGQVDDRLLEPELSSAM